MEAGLLDDLEKKLASPKLWSRALIQAAQPAPIETIAEWADKNMVLPSWDAEPGPWRTSRTPFLKEIMECLSPRAPYREVSFMKPAQIGGTSVGKNWIGYTVHRSPAAMLIVEPTLDIAGKLSKQRIAPMFEDVPALRGLVREARERDSGNTILAKEFAGGMIVMTGANSGPGLRFMAAERLFLDEIDAYKVLEREGHPVDIAEKRTLTYGRYKVYKCSTPLLAGSSIIEQTYQDSDQRRYFIPCHFCDHGQVLYWKNLIWPKGKPELAAYECEQCHELIPEHHKTGMLLRGQWIKGRPEVKGKAGFHLNALYAPYGWVNSWGYLAKQWTEIIHKRDRAAQQVFTNTNLAETWSEEGERVEATGLMTRREIYPAPVPDGALVLTAAVDVQDDRLEALVKGWGEDEESWAITYKIFHGSPAQRDVWNQAETWLGQRFIHETGPPMRIQLAAVDTGGHQTKAAYEFVKRCRTCRAIAVKGSNIPGHPIVGRASKKNIGNVKLFPIGTDTAKDTIFARLKIEEFGPGCCHFPTLPEFDAEYFAQLTAEARTPKYIKGIQVGSFYRKLRARNEALDLEVYNLAMLALLNPNWKALKNKHEALAGETPPKAPDEPHNPPPKPQGSLPPWPARGGKWTKGWR